MATKQKIHRGFFVISCEGMGEQRTIKGFVSYKNQFSHFQRYDQYHPVSFEDASVFYTREDAEIIKNWYIRRGGIFDNMKIIELKPVGESKNEINYKEKYLNLKSAAKWYLFVAQGKYKATSALTELEDYAEAVKDLKEAIK